MRREGSGFRVQGSGRPRASALSYAPLCPLCPLWPSLLSRTVGDALTGVVWVDDNQVVRWRGSKDYGPPAGVQIRVGLMRECLTGDRTCESATD